MKLIVETSEDIKYISEGETWDKDKKLYIEGIFMQSNIKNKNGRLYPKEVLSKEVDRYIKEHVETKSAFGELNHPPTPIVSLDRASHLITQLKEDGDNFIGKAQVLSTPMGNIVRNLINDEVRLSVSSRALGAYKPNNQGVNEVYALRLSTAADIVAHPSAPSAFVKGVMENVSYWLNPNTNEWEAEQIDEQRKQMRKMSVSDLEKRALILFENYLNTLNNK